MEVIANELHMNGIYIDTETLSDYIEYIRTQYKDTYHDAVKHFTHEQTLLNVFHQMDVNNFGRAIAYLTLAYHMSYLVHEDTVREATRLTVPILRNTARVENTFIWNLCSWGMNKVFTLCEIANIKNT